MKLGFLTNALVSEGLRDIESMAHWAADHGFNALEVGPTLPLDEAAFSRVIDQGRIALSALTYCRNFLSGSKAEAQEHRDELLRRIEAAGRLGIPLVVTSTGINKLSTGEHHDSYDAIRPKPERSLDEVEAFFAVALDRAERCGVKLAVENCPLMGNISISPAMWAKLLERLDSPAFGLAYDPSHLIWQQIDPYDPILEFGSRILHVHAKDTEVNRRQLTRTGILTDFSWWRYRLPGLGELNWTRFISNLTESGFAGAISIEHEDPVWGGTVEKTQEGLLLAKQFLETVPGFRHEKA